uniref:Skp1_POZ domain-containing protein n=1 Tax=Caenorhabditis tropicalis TaxID=1561998 RepID=A0A1I7U7M1_9PELO
MADANVPVVQISKEPIPSDPEMIYTVTSEEGIEFRVSDKALRMSETMNAMLGATPEDVARNDAIPINNIKGDILELVFKWCEEHKGESIPVDDGSIPKNATTTTHEDGGGSDDEGSCTWIKRGG